MVDVDLIKKHDMGYPKSVRRRNAWVQKKYSLSLKHRRDLLKYKKRVRCNPTVFELRRTCSCPTCGQPVNKFNYSEKIWNKVVMDDAADI